MLPVWEKSRFVDPAWVARANDAVLRGHVAPAIEAGFLKHSHCLADITLFVSTLDAVPVRFHRPILRRFESEHRKGGNAGFKVLWGVREAFQHGGLDLAADDDELRRMADDWARDVRGMLADQGGIAASADIRAKLFAYVKRRGIPVTDAMREKPLRGVVGRLTDPAWWVRQLRKTACRLMEQQAIGLGMVHKHASIYASTEAVARRQKQRRRNAAMLANTEAENELGQVFTLAELSEKNVSNPAIRRAELMTRIAGFERFADSRGDVGMFITATCPSRMHPRYAISGQENPKWDGTTPRQAQGYLGRVWAKARAWLHRQGVFLYGFRVVEPHHDGTPHWHCLFFMAAGVVASVVKKLQEYFSEADAHELETTAAKEARFKAVPIDRERGSAAGYIAKYIAKNIDGYSGGGDFESADGSDILSTVGNVDAWAATHGIRQFQQIGGPGVTVWRELRRVREDRQGDLFAPFLAAADGGKWDDYVSLMGGIQCRRAHRPLQLWKVDEGRENRYGEPAGADIHGVEHLTFERLLSRVHRWNVRPGGGVAFDSPWTRVNNCTGVDGEHGIGIAENDGKRGGGGSNVGETGGGGRPGAACFEVGGNDRAPSRSAGSEITEKFDGRGNFGGYPPWMKQTE